MTYEGGGFILSPMKRTILALAAAALAAVVPADAAAQEGAEPGDPMRIAIMVDNSQTPLDPLPQIREVRGPVFPIHQSTIYKSSNSYSPSPFIISIMC